MTARALQAARGAPPSSTSVIAGALAGAAVGGATAWNPTVGLVLLGLFAVGAMLALRSSAVLIVLSVSVFVEATRVGSTNIARILAPIALVALIVAMARGEASVRSGDPVRWVFLYSVWALASGLWTSNLGATVSQLGSLAIALTYWLAFAGLITRRQHLERVLAALAVASFVVAVLAIHDYLSAGSPSALNRAAGDVGDPNFFAAYEIIVIPPLLVFAGEVRRRWLSALLYLSLLVVVASVLTTLSRGGLLALGVVVILMFVVPARKLFSSRRQKARVAVAVLLAGGLGFATVAGSFTPRLNSLLSEGGGSGRLVLWQGALTAIKEHPFTGLGYGGFQSASDNLIYRTPGVSLQAYDLLPQGQVAHNVYLGTAADLGLPGLVLFVGLILSTGGYLYRVGVRAYAVGARFVGRVANALILSLAGWVIASLFLSTETSRPFWIILGIALALPKLIDVRVADASPAAAIPSLRSAQD